MKTLLLISLAALIAAQPASAKHHSAALKWMNGPDGLPAGAQLAVLKGEPGKAGPFTIQLKLPANYAVPAHHHPANEHVTVLSGRTYYGMSDKLDKAKAKTLTPGHHLVMRAGQNHWVYTTDAGSTVEIKAKGPFQIVYVDPKDDPRKK